VLWGVGGAGLALGAVTGVLFLAKKSNLEDKCPNQKCPREADAQPDIDRYRLYGWLSGTGLGVGIAAAAAGTALYFIGGDEPPPSSSARGFIAPYIGPGTVGAYGSF
jgi:hypothetical protein